MTVQQRANYKTIDDGYVICSLRSDSSVCSDDFETLQPVHLDAIATQVQAYMDEKKRLLDSKRACEEKRAAICAKIKRIDKRIEQIQEQNRAIYTEH